MSHRLALAKLLKTSFEFLLFLPWVKMPRYYYRNRSRFYRRRRSALSTRNLLTRKSATAQALQIRAVNRKVNRVLNICKPEKKVAHGDNMNHDFTNSVFDSAHYEYNPPAIALGPNDNQRIGNKIWRRDTYAFNLLYTNNAANSEGFVADIPSCATLRAILVIDKIPSAQNNTLSASSIVHGVGSSLSGYDYWMSQPLEDNVTERYRVIQDHIFTVDLTNLSKFIKIKTPWYESRFNDNNNPPDVIQSHLILLSGNLKAATGFSDKMHVHGTRKTVFMDA